jgi:hypothetical protein
MPDLQAKFKAHLHKDMDDTFAKLKKVLNLPNPSL